RAKPVTAALCKMTKDPETEVKLAALRALGACGKPAVPVLTEALKDLHSEVLVVAAGSLGRIGPEAREAIPGLLLLWKDDEETIKNAAGDALKKIDADAASRAGVK